MKWRYLAATVEGEESIQGKEVLNAVWKTLTQLFGEYGASQAELTLIRGHTQKDYFVLRCSRKALPMVRASIAAITEIGEKPASVHVLRVSGTLKALRKKTDSAACCLKDVEHENFPEMDSEAQ
ncbi:MAG: Rpp14/Pop5 family protein [Candidatus Bathyarchaeota archaeon]|jgi:ribonuclease P/MRP protein subunit POP5